MKFSLIMGTVGRSVEIERFILSLLAQDYDNYELIMIDQNEDDRAKTLYDKYCDKLTIRYLRSERGLSRARNVGLRQARGDIIAFPDDDCSYLPNILSYVASQFNAEERLSCLTGCSIDSTGKPTQGRWARRTLTVNRYNIFVCVTSYTVFIRGEAAAKIGPFDETLGIGSGTLWGSGEETNYLLQLLENSMYVRYDPALRIIHGEPNVVLNDKAFSRGRLYNRGFGRVLRLNCYSYWFVLYVVARPLVGVLVGLSCLDVNKAKYHWIAASNRFLGWAVG
jgi:glycosyltransferase involved in cell wall biosynthesis